MTEREWLACTELKKMLGFLADKASDRKMRLFICACCRLVWELLTETACRKAVEVGELYADGVVAEARFQAASGAVDRAAERVMEEEYDPGGYGAPQAATYACCARGAAPALAWSAVTCAGAAANMNGMYSASHEQIACLRDILGNPFRPILINRAWQTPTVVSLAQAAYDNRILPVGTLDNTRLTVLADALEEAGCDNADILTHLRQPGEHVRGCWVVDLLLGKE